MLLLVGFMIVGFAMLGFRPQGFAIRRLVIRRLVTRGFPFWEERMRRNADPCAGAGDSRWGVQRHAERGSRVGGLNSCAADG